MSVRKKGATEDQILSNKKLLREAEDMSILNSWFKVKSPAIKQSDSNEMPQINSSALEVASMMPDEDDEDNFSADSDTGGLGSVKHNTTTAGNASDRQNLSTNDNLRRQFLGKNAQLHFKRHQGQIGSKPRPSQQQQQQHQSRRGRAGKDDSDDEDEGGRTQITGKKQPSKNQRGINDMAPSSVSSPIAATTTTAAGLSASGAENNTITTTGTSTTSISSTTGTLRTDKSTKKRKATTYLDEMLAERGKKKKPAKRSDD